MVIIVLYGQHLKLTYLFSIKIIIFILSLPPKMGSAFPKNKKIKNYSVFFSVSIACNIIMTKYELYESMHRMAHIE